jgi:hypothetical protein
MLSDHIILLLSLVFRAWQIALFVPIIFIAAKEIKHKDYIWIIRISVLVMLLLYFSSVIVMLYTTYCRFDDCYNRLNLDALNLYSAVASFALTGVLLYLYRRKFTE